MTSELLESSKQEAPRYWYAMGAPYGRETKVVGYLKCKETEAETFIPLERVERIVGVKIEKRLVSYRPAVRNLFFVNATEEKMRDIKQKYNSLLQFKVKPTTNGFVPIIVPDRQMENFMFLYSHVDEGQREIFAVDEIELRPNAKVMIKDGLFAGRVGYFQQVRSKKTKKGVREKRFVVKLDGLLACAAVIAECQYVSWKEEDNE